MQVTAFSVANSIRMARTQFSGSFLVTEGDTDARLLKRFIGQDQCRTIVATDKQTAIEVMHLLDEDKFQGAIAIVDADYDRITSCLPSSDNIIATEFNDLDMVMVNSPALHKVLDEFGTEDKIKQVEGIHGQQIRDILINAAAVMGSLRVVSIQEQYGLKFKGCKYAKALNEERVTVDLLDMVKCIQNNSGRHELDANDLAAKCQAVLDDGHVMSALCCGHDFTNFLAVGLRKALGSCKPAQVDAAAIERSLRMGYEEEMFKQSVLYSLIRQWEKRTHPFKVLK